MSKLPKIERKTKSVQVTENIENIQIESLEEQATKFVESGISSAIIRDNLNEKETDLLISSDIIIEKINYFKKLNYPKTFETRMQLAEENENFLKMLKNVFNIHYVDAINMIILDYLERNKKTIQASKDYKKFRKSLE